ncbi:MAG: peptide chain release factor N(5)-glutamine methyltransferase [Lentisphaeria bacterium]|nr:peptide chain release factor N(5)-glutamine methyltransferase [Lentisphaeria bacterium]
MSWRTSNFSALRQEISRQLQQVGIDIRSAEFEAAWILEEVFGKNKFQLSLERNLQFSEPLENRLNEILSRRLQREPLQYILGKAYFMDLELFVSPDVLIPRPETEIMAEAIIRELPPGGRMIDVGCGSGAIGLAVAQARSDAQVLEVDISDAALNVARKNCAKYHLSNVKFLHSSLLEQLQATPEWNLIAANLPYVSFSEYESLELEVKNFEPQLALTAADDGLALITELLQNAWRYLTADGVIYLESGIAHPTMICQLVKNDKNYQSCSIIKDYNNFNRFNRITV